MATDHFPIFQDLNITHDINPRILRTVFNMVSEEKMKKLDLQSLLDFYDYLVKGSEKHASALNAILGEDMAVSLMKDYWTSLGFDFKEFSPCNQGTQKAIDLIVGCYSQIS